MVVVAFSVGESVKMGAGESSTRFGTGVLGDLGELDRLNRFLDASSYAGGGASNEGGASAAGSNTVQSACRS